MNSQDMPTVTPVTSGMPMTAPTIRPVLRSVPLTALTQAHGQAPMAFKHKMVAFSLDS